MTEPILTPFLGATDVTVYQGDCIEVMRQMPENSVDAIVTDPPYGLGFMGKDWDKAKQLASTPPSATEDTPLGRFRLGKGPGAVSFDAIGFQAFSEAWAREAYRILKPGGHLLAFAGTRTYHRMASGVEDAGFEIRDCIAWMYGSGFPKSLDVSKAIDKAAGANREVVGRYTSPEGTTGLRSRGHNRNTFSGDNYSETNEGDGLTPITAPATPDAEKWSGWGTALKPAFEPVVVARKPLIGTVAQNVLEHGTGALNIDACRIGTNGEKIPMITGKGTLGGTSDGYDRPWKRDPEAVKRREERALAAIEKANDLGRWPANVTLDETAAAMLDEQSGYQKDGTTYLDNRTVDYNASSYKIVDNRGGTRGYGGGGGASRFFYTAKASKKDRNTNGANNTHPTVKPTTLMRWLIRLVTPPGGIILDPFGGSGSTGVAARAEGVRCILIEREAEYLDIIRQRLDEGPLFSNLD